MPLSMVFNKPYARPKLPPITLKLYWPTFASLAMPKLRLAVTFKAQVKWGGRAFTGPNSNTLCLTLKYLT